MEKIIINIRNLSADVFEDLDVFDKAEIQEHALRNLVQEFEEHLEEVNELEKIRGYEEDIDPRWEWETLSDIASEIKDVANVFLRSNQVKQKLDNLIEIIIRATEISEQRYTVKVRTYSDRDDSFFSKKETTFSESEDDSWENAI